MPSDLSPAGLSFLGANVYGSAAKTISNNTNTEVDTWDTVRTDIGGWHSDSAQDRLTVPACVKYVDVGCTLGWAGNPTGSRIVGINHYNSSDTLIGIVYTDNREGASLLGTTHALTAMNVAVSEGDYFTLEVFQLSGGDLALQIDETFSSFYIRRVG